MTQTELCVTTDSQEATQELGRKIGQVLDAGACIALVGTLGAGKTELVKGIAAGAGVPPEVPVNSPTFVIINEYPGRVYIYHVDAYRLRSPDELTAIGFAEMITSGGVVVVEWADRVIAVMPADRITVCMEHVSETTRRITLCASQASSIRVIAALCTAT